MLIILACAFIALVILALHVAPRRESLSIGSSLGKAWSKISSKFWDSFKNPKSSQQAATEALTSPAMKTALNQAEATNKTALVKQMNADVATSAQTIGSKLAPHKLEGDWGLLLNKTASANQKTAKLQNFTQWAQRNPKQAKEAFQDGISPEHVSRILGKDPTKNPALMNSWDEFTKAHGLMKSGAPAQPAGKLAWVSRWAGYASNAIMAAGTLLFIAWTIKTIIEEAKEDGDEESSGDGDGGESGDGSGDGGLADFVKSPMGIMSMVLCVIVVIVAFGIVVMFAVSSGGNGGNGNT